MPDSFPVPDHFYYNIGLIAAKWSAIEAELDLAILEGYGIDAGTGLILSSQIGYRGKTQLIRVLLNWKADHEPPKDQEMFDLMTDVDNAYARRNSAVHSVWSGTENPNVGSQASIRAKGKLRYGYVTVPIEELEADAVELNRIGRKLRVARETNRFRTEDGDENTTQT